MKKSFTKIATLLAGLMILATSCNNASQIMFEDETKSKFTDDGLSPLTVKIGSTPEYRTIFPNDWDESNKNKLLYCVTGTATDNLIDISTIKKENTFFYSEIVSGDAKIALDPMAWNLKLTVYQPTNLKEKTPDTTKPVLEATAAPDMSTGRQTVLFNLQPVSNQQDATGAVDIEVFFYNEDGFDNITLTNGTYTVGPLKIGAEGVSLVPNQKNYYSTHFSNESLKAGKSTFKVTIKSTEKTILEYEETLIIDGGNLSAKEIRIPQGSYNKKPEAPTDLTAECIFAPTENVLYINGDKTKVAQESTAADTSSNYDLNLSWKDKSFNEQGFKIDFITVNAAGAETPSSVKYNKTEPNTPTTTGTAVTIKNGTLAPSDEKITLVIPTGTFCKAIKVTAYNDIGENSSNIVADTTPIGMFTVSYDLTAPNSSKTEPIEPKYTPMKYSSAEPTTKQFFITAYNYGTRGSLPTDNKDNYPFVAHPKFSFGCWTEIAPAPESTPATYSNIEDLKNKNSTIIGVWTSPAEVKVTFPSYEGVKKLQAVGNHNMGEVLEPTKDSNGNLAVTISIPTDTKNSKPGFKIIGPDSTTIAFNNLDGETGKEESSIDATTAGTIKWNLTDFLTRNDAGIYRVYVKYTYTDDTGKTYPIDGNLFVKVPNSVNNN